jgi:DNA-binding NtrC family response regulator
VVERSLPFSDGPIITIDALPEALKGTGKTPSTTTVPDLTQSGGSVPQPASSLPFKDAKDQLVEAFERQYLIDLLERHDGNVSKAARVADMDRKTITRLMKKHGITRSS